MSSASAEQIRSFRLKAHHLDQPQAAELAAACGFQNSPPGAWETAFYNRAPGLSLGKMKKMLEEDKTLVQAWSIRGLPLIFPAKDRHVFLSSLVPLRGEPWIYTRGITLALDFLGISFEQAMDWLLQVISRLDSCELVSKTALDETLAGWMLPLLPEGKRSLWTAPSMYGNPEKQTVSGKRAFILAKDHELLFSPPSFNRELILLGGHDPYLDQRDRWILQEDVKLQRKIWPAVASPGVVLFCGKAAGVWNCKKKGKALEFAFTLWNDIGDMQKLQDLARLYAKFRQQELSKIIIRR